MIKKGNSYDKLFHGLDNNVQVVMHVKNEENIPKIINKLKKLCLPLRLKYVDDTYFWNESEPPVVKIPDNITNIVDVSRWVTINSNPFPKTSLGVLAANKNFIAANASHALWDGKVMISVVDAIVNDIDIPEIDQFYNCVDTFPEEIAQAEAYPESDLTHKGLTRFTSKDKFFKTANNNSQFCVIRTPVKELKCYDPILKRPTGLTDVLYTNICLACSAYEGKLDKIGLASCVDLRKFIPYPYGFERHNVFSSIDIVAKDVTLNTTIREVMKKTRDAYNQRINEKAHFGYLKHLNDQVDLRKQINKFRPSLSNFGIFTIGGPIDDLFVKNSIIYGQNIYYGADFLYYGIKGNGKDDICTVFEYLQHSLSRREADLLLNSLVFGLKNLDLDLTCGEAIERLQEFQHNYIKNEYPKYECHYK